MDPITSAALRSWDWRVEVLVVCGLLAALYFRGWRRLRKGGGGPHRLASSWRLVAYGGGLALLLLALLSPLDVLAGQFFFVHMLQHLVLMMLIPPLLLLANPMPFLLWGLPAGARRRVGALLSRLLHSRGAPRRALRGGTGPGVAWLFLVICLIGWHDPQAYDAALRSELVHDLEHLMFFSASMLYWWHVIGAGPYIHKRLSRPGRVAYLIAAIPPTMLIGVFITFAGQPLYPYYLTVPRIWSISVLDDQMLGGVLMWVPGSMMYILAVLIVTGRWLESEETKPPLPMSNWSTPEQMAAPGAE